MKKRPVFLTMAMIAFLALAGCAPAKNTKTQNAADGNLSASKSYKIATVVKLLGISWFDRTAQGLKTFARDYGVDSYMVGPETADSALQVKIIEDLIAERIDAICVIPISAEALEPVLKKARDAGIVVISHEASNLNNIDFDIEAFENAAYGAHLMDTIGRLTSGQGGYAQFVGTLTSTSHNEWCDAGEALQKEKYPDMKLLTARLEDNEDTKTAYNKTRELITAYPGLKAVQSSSMSGTAGAALAIDEMGLQNQVAVVGTCLVSVAGDYLTSGAADMISFWDPALAGYAMNKLALLVLEGKKNDIINGYDLGIDGYNKLTKNGAVLYASAWLDATKENMSSYNF